MKSGAGAIAVAQAQWPEYQLEDSGNGRKLERFGPVRLVRSEPKAWWQPQLGADAWGRADAQLSEGGAWRLRPGLKRSWPMAYGPLVLEARLTEMSKHVGIFPEQAPHWEWITRWLGDGRGKRVLNLFGYTGVATLVAAATGAEVTHVDASKPALAWARHNQALSGMEAAPVRWILEDAFKYVGRELKRGRRYDLVLLDPPSFGRGPKGEVWKVEAQIGALLGQVARLLSGERAAMVLTLYNLEASSLMLANLARSVMGAGALEYGELVLSGAEGIALPLSLYARWSRPLVAERA